MDLRPELEAESTRFTEVKGEGAWEREGNKGDLQFSGTCNWGDGEDVHLPGEERERKVVVNWQKQSANCGE